MNKFSAQHLAILKNFASINPNLEVKVGNRLATIAEAKNIYAVATLDEPFTKAFGIYDLNEFNAMINLIGDPELTFEDTCVKLKGEQTSGSFRYSDPSILTTPQKDITMPPTDIKVSVTWQELCQIRKGASVLGHNIVSIESDNGKLSMKVIDPNNPTANTFVMDLDGDSHGSTFACQFMIENLKVLEGDYDVEISSKFISHWTHTTQAIEYFIALEKTSTFLD
jgi:hypothetical protein